MQRLQRQMKIDRRWDSAIDRLEIKYGLRLDDWKRLGRDQMGQKCGRGWQGLRGACKRVPKGGDKEAAIKASKVALADKIRARKGLSDRNAPKADPKVEKARGSRITKDEVNAEPWKFTAQQYQDAHGVKQPWIAEIAPARMAEQGKREKSRYFKERAKEWDASASIKAEWGGKVWDAYKKGKITDADIQDDSGNRGTFGDLSAKQLVYSRKKSEKKASFDADFQKAKETNQLQNLDEVKVGSRVFDNVGRKYLEVAKKHKTKVMAIDEDGATHSVQTGRLNWKSHEDLVFAVKNGESIKPRKSMDSRKDSPHFDSHEILRYTCAIAVLNDRYGWHLDAQKVLSKLGKKLGKKCGGGWISPEKRCKSHYTNGKLNEAGKASGENLADRIRQRKNLATVSRNGKGRELSYAFLPGNQKQSTMTARRTHAPNAGYQTPGRLTNLSGTEERRSIVGLGQSPGKKRQPDDAPIMDIPVKRTAPTTTAGAQYLAHPQTNESMRKHEGVKMIANAIDFNGGFVDMGVKDLGTVKVIKLNPKSKGQGWGSATIETDAGDGIERRNVSLPIIADAVKRTPQDKATKSDFDRQNKQGQENMHGAITPTPIATMEERRIAKQNDGKKTKRQLMELHLKFAEDNAARYLESGKKSGLPQYANLDEKAVRKLARQVQANEFVIDPMSWTFNGRASGGGADHTDLVESGLLNPPNNAQKYPLTRVGKEFAKEALLNIKNGRIDQQVKESTQAPKSAMDTVKPNQSTPIEAGKSLKSLFAEADRVGSKYQDKPQTLDERRVSKQGADRVMNESGMKELVAKASGAASISEARKNRDRMANAPIRSSNQRSAKEPRRIGRSVD